MNIINISRTPTGFFIAAKADVVAKHFPDGMCSFPIYIRHSGKINVTSDTNRKKYKFSINSKGGFAVRFPNKIMESEGYFGSTKCTIKDGFIFLPDKLNIPQKRTRDKIGEVVVKSGEVINFIPNIDKLREAKIYINECAKAGFMLTIKDNQLDITMKI